MTDALRKAKAAEQQARESLLEQIGTFWAHGCGADVVMARVEVYAEAVRLTERAKEGR